MKNFEDHPTVQWWRNRTADQSPVLATPLIDYNPCIDCKLCVAACPVGALASDGHFNFSACYTHNYRELMGGFTDWAETIAGSKSAHDYREKFSAAESYYYCL